VNIQRNKKKKNWGEQAPERKKKKSTGEERKQRRERVGLEHGAKGHRKKNYGRAYGGEEKKKARRPRTGQKTTHNLQATWAAMPKENQSRQPQDSQTAVGERGINARPGRAKLPAGLVTANTNPVLVPFPQTNKRKSAERRTSRRVLWGQVAGRSSINSRKKKHIGQGFPALCLNTIIRDGGVMGRKRHPKNITPF